VVPWSVPAFLLAATSVGPRASGEVGRTHPLAAALKKYEGDESLTDPSPYHEYSLTEWLLGQTARQTNALDASLSHYPK
jgi:hypothetical protein